MTYREAFALNQEHLNTFKHNLVSCGVTPIKVTVFFELYYAVYVVLDDCNRVWRYIVKYTKPLRGLFSRLRKIVVDTWEGKADTKVEKLYIENLRQRKSAR